MKMPHSSSSSSPSPSPSSAPSPKKDLMEGVVIVPRPSFEFPSRPKYTNVSRLLGNERAEVDAARSSNSNSEETVVVRKSQSASKLAGSGGAAHLVSRTANQKNNRPSPAVGAENIPLSPRRSVNRRHSIETVDIKKPLLTRQDALTRPQPAPRSAHNLARTGWSSPAAAGNPAPSDDGPDAATTRSGPGACHRDVDEDVSTALESGYARIIPRRLSASDRNVSAGSGATVHSHSRNTLGRVESAGRRASVSSSRRSSADAGSNLSVKSGNSYPQLPSPATSLPRSPLSPLPKGSFDFGLDHSW